VPEFDSYLILRKLVLAFQNVLALFVSGEKPGRELEYDYAQLAGAVQRQKGIVKSLPELVPDFCWNIVVIKILFARASAGISSSRL
jgi:hypothetical protein